MPQPTTFQSLRIAKGALEIAVGKWNAYHGQIWDVKATLDDQRFERFVQLADCVFNGHWLTDTPGPFKRLGAYAIAVQYYSPYVWQKNNAPLPSLEQELWVPRMTVWSLPFLGHILRLNDEPLKVQIVFPTQHSQVEVVAFLRRLFNSAHEQVGPQGVAIDELTERVTAMGLLIETSAYASYPDTDRLSDITRHAKGCVNSYDPDDPRWPDLFFMNADFLDAAAGLGID